MRIKEVAWYKSKSKYANVFHYTSPEGILSILKNKKIRFTDCQFFNDKSEYIYIRTPLVNALKTIFPKLYNTDLIENIDNWLIENYEVPVLYRGQAKQRYYVFCTSLEEDSLNMWHYYLKNDRFRGYNIGLSVPSLVKYVSQIEMEEAEIWHGPIIYSSFEQDRILVNLISDIDNSLRKIKQEVSYSEYLYSYLQEAQEDIIKSIELYRLFFKSAEFSGEREYRFVLKLPTDLPDNAFLSSGYQVKDGIISPYFDLSFIDEIIDCITISPNMEGNLAKKGLELFLKKENYKTLKIKQSNIPVRY